MAVERSEPLRRSPGGSVSRRFSTQARTGTTPEIALRKSMHRLGLRYRVHHPILGLPRRRVDVAFTRAKIAVFVDGCFWHGCPDHGNLPKANREWWTWKLDGNRARDRDTDHRLHELGWRVIRIWEHEEMGTKAVQVAFAVKSSQISATQPRSP